MGRLVECKTCRHQVDQTAKVCPGCGVRNPGINTAKGCLLMTGLILLMSFSIAYFTTDRPREEIQVEQTSELLPEQTANIITKRAADSIEPAVTQIHYVLNDHSLDQFLKEYGQDYVTQAVKLSRGFKRFLEKNDERGFTFFKKNEWLPGFSVNRAKYDSILEENRKYVMDNDLLFLFAQFDDLGLYAHRLWTDLRRSDKSIRKDVSEKMIRDAAKLEDLFKQRHLKFEFDVEG